MNFLAIPIGLNGLIKPVSLGVVPADETVRLKSAFVNNDTAYFDLLLKQETLQISSKGLYDAKPLQNMSDRFAKGLQPLMKAGAIWEDGTAMLVSDHLKAGELQIDTAGPMHIDASAKIYENDLMEDRIMVRGLWVSEQSPVICDVSEVVHPLATMIYGRVQPEDELRYEAQGLIFTPAERTFMLMDTVTPHAARPVLSDTHRLLVDFRAKLKLPADWRMRAQYKLSF